MKDVNVEQEPFVETRVFVEKLKKKLLELFIFITLADLYEYLNKLYALKMLNNTFLSSFNVYKLLDHGNNRMRDDDDNVDKIGYKHYSINLHLQFYIIPRSTTLHISEINLKQDVI